MPQLPDAQPQGLTARQLIEQHSSVAACAKCHAKIDPYGFALEQYDAIGRLRSQAVDTQTKLVADLEFESIDVIQLVVALEERFRRRNLGFDQLLMVDGRYVDDLDVAAIVRFLSTRLAS